MGATSELTYLPASANVAANGECRLECAVFLMSGFESRWELFPFPSLSIK